MGDVVSESLNAFEGCGRGTLKVYCWHEDPEWKTCLIMGNVWPLFDRECGRQVHCPLAGPIPSDPGATGEGLYAKVIDGAYRFASRCLMDLIVREVGFP